MKKYLFLIIFFPITVISQTLGMSYKAIIRDDAGNIMANQEILVELTLNIIPINFPAYIESHTVTTNDNGLFILTIGEGTPINGTFSSLDWLNDRFELNVQVDAGSGLIDMGSAPFYSVPYSYHTETAISAQTATIATDLENIPGLEPLDEGNGIGWRLAGRDPLHYGPIGENAIDFSFSENDSHDHGALGDHSFAVGTSLIASGNHSTALGYGLLTEGNFSFAQGSQSMATESFSFAVGFFARATGEHSVALGSDSQASGEYSFSGPDASARGDYSFSVGDNALSNSLNAVAIGANSLAIADNGFAAGFESTARRPGSMALGYQAETRADKSIAMGYGVWSNAYASTVLGTFNELVTGSPTAFLPLNPLLEVGNGTSPTNRSTALMILKNGNVGIGTTNPVERLHIANGRLRIGTETVEDTGSNRLEWNSSLFPDTDDTFQLGGSALRWEAVWATDGTINTSDRREKKDIKGLKYGLREILDLNPVSFRWKAKPEQGEKLGLIAQDLLEIIPEVVKTHEYMTIGEDENATLEKKELDRLGVYYTDLIPVLIKAIQEQQEIIQSYKSEQQQNKAAIADLQSQMNQLSEIVQTKSYEK